MIFILEGILMIVGLFLITGVLFCSLLAAIYIWGLILWALPPLDKFLKKNFDDEDRAFLPVYLIIALGVLSLIF